MSTLVDSHCHLCFAELSSDMDGVLSRAREAGVVRMLNVCTNMREFPEVHKVALKYDDVYCSVGVHPHHAEEEKHIIAEDIIAAAAKDKVVGIGEAGLDFHYDHSPRDIQEKIFREHIRACLRSELPLIIHSREAEADTMRIIDEETAGQGNKLRAVLHCFSSKRELAEWGLAKGFYVSASGVVTFKKSQELRNIFREVPLDRILVETDSPFLAPQSRRGKTCEPAYVVETARVIADVKGISFDAFTAQTNVNFFKLFNKVSAP